MKYLSDFQIQRFWFLQRQLTTSSNVGISWALFTLRVSFDASVDAFWLVEDPTDFSC